ncbi:MAG TPA: hypothetical protein VJ249_06680 [Candidatus Bathyarchaeia archaeon]|nr:hypothetical protein [Candidatus Bathyarchaeia archaeon]
MVEERVKDLYRVGLILFVAPLLISLILTILGRKVDLDDVSTSLSFYTPILAGLLLMLYLSMKYYYREGKLGN